MQQPKYQHAQWGILVKDGERGKIYFDFHSNQLFLPGSVSKLFSIAALLHAYGDQYRFKTPVYMLGIIENDVLKGDLILVGKGDLTLGGRQNDGVIAFTKLDHTYANDIPGAVLTEEDPLKGLNDLAKQIKEKGISKIEGNILVDDRLFEKTEQRGIILTPIMVNENLIDFTINPTLPNESATLAWRPQVPGYTVTNKVKTVPKGENLQITVTSDEGGRNIVVEGTIPADQKDIVRIFPVKDPVQFAQAAFVLALKNQGITILQNNNKEGGLPSQEAYQKMQPIATWTSPPLSEYAKLILKVSHNMGANLVPLLLAVQKGERTYEQGMPLLGRFIEDEVSIGPGNFVFVDAAGGDNNRLTPQATVKLLDYIRQLPVERFQNFYQALPILGKDGTLTDVSKNSDAAGKVFAKTGTGISYNIVIDEFFLATQALAGYILDKNHRFIEFMIVVNNAQMPEMKDIFPIFEDQGQMSDIVYELLNGSS